MAMGMDQVQPLIPEAIKIMGFIQDLVSEVPQYQVWEQVRVGWLLKRLKGEEEIAYLRAVVIPLLLTFSVSKTGGQEPQSQRARSQLNMLLLLMVVVRLGRLLQGHGKNYIISLTLSPTMRMPNSL